MNVPTTAYRPVAPTAFLLDPYLPYLIDKIVRIGRNNGYANLVDDGLELLLADFNVRQPQGGFVDSDGVNAHGVKGAGDFGADGFNADGFNRRGYDKEGFNADGFNAKGESREEVVEEEVEGWSTEKAAAVLAALAGRIG